MKIEALEAFGIEQAIIRMWSNAGHRELLPIQLMAIRKGKVLDGGNAVVFSPTSSGKTFVGEMAAVRVACQGRRVIYLVPQKALAEEKYEEFQRRYGQHGIKIVISTRDRKEHDQDIRHGDYRIAVVVFEKMQALMVSNPAILKNVGLIVVDELQMLGDATRGPGLELLLTKVRLAKDKPQIICLSAVIGNADKLANWLDATFCEDTSRPVELRKGVLYQGEFRYIEHNSGVEHVETIGRPIPRAESLAIVTDQVKEFAGRGEQSLIFCKSKKECTDTAQIIAGVLQAKPSHRVIEELNALEESNGRDHLARLLQNGVAYHNSDLDWDQRDVIERGFRSGEIKVLCSTTTLAMGMNLPVRNVFIDPNRWCNEHRSWTTIPITQAEYENISGRAGRFGIEEQFGRAIIVATSQFEYDTFFECFVKGSLEDFEPALAGVSLSQHVLNLAASGLSKNRNELRDMLLTSFTGSLYWNDEIQQHQFIENLNDAIDNCIEGGLISEDKKSISVTRLGKAAAAKGISVETAIEMAAFAREHSDAADDINPLEILWCLSGTMDGENTYFNLATREYQSTEYTVLFREAIAALPYSARQRFSYELDGVATTYEVTKRIKKTLLLYDWVLGVKTREIETRFHCFSGSIRGLAGEFAWLAEAMASVADACNWSKPNVKRLSKLAEQLIGGIKEQGLDLTRLRVQGLGRGRIAALVDNGLDTIGKVLSAPFAELQKIVTKPVAERIQEYVQRKDLQATSTADYNGEATETTFEETTTVSVTREERASEDESTSRLCNTTIHLDGQIRKKRYLILVDGKEAWVRRQPFEAAFRMAIQARQDSGWVSGIKLSQDKYHQVFHRLKQDLECTGVDASALIENNAYKQYRFSIPQENITLDDEKIRLNEPELAQLLEAEENAA